MSEQTDIFKKYRATFPSSEWLEKHFGEDYTTSPHSMPDTRITMHEYLRRIFDAALRSTTVRQIRNLDREAKGFEKVYTFKDGKLCKLPTLWLNRYGLVNALSSQATSVLCREFITHLKADTFHEDDWWHWQTRDQSVWIEVKPEANQMGGNQPRRSLSDILGEFD